MKINIAVLAGDGIGPEIMAQALHVTQAVCDRFGHELSYEEAMVGACAIDAVGDPYPPETHALCMQSDAVLFGAIGHPKFDNNPFKIVWFFVGDKGDILLLSSWF